MTSLKIWIGLKPVPMTLYVIVNSNPLLVVVCGGGPNPVTAECAIPAPSVAIQPVPAPLIQLISSKTVVEKLTAKRLPVMVRL